MLVINSLTYAQNRTDDCWCIDVLKEDFESFNTIIHLTNPDSLNRFYQNLFLPNKYLEFTYAMQMYRISQGKIIVEQLFTSMPQSKIEFFYFYHLTEYTFNDEKLDNTLSDFVNEYYDALGNNIETHSEYMPAYLKFGASLSGEIVDVYLSWLIHGFKNNPRMFVKYYEQLNDKTKSRIKDILDYGEFKLDDNFISKWTE